ncbi:MAG: hypothetical protein LBF65_02670 [Holosporales bacterium]|nr:hypothetical protein [Holosporales bacterium]
MFKRKWVLYVVLGIQSVISRSIGAEDLPGQSIGADLPGQKMGGEIRQNDKGSYPPIFSFFDPNFGMSAELCYVVTQGMGQTPAARMSRRNNQDDD